MRRTVRIARGLALAGATLVVTSCKHDLTPPPPAKHFVAFNARHVNLRTDVPLELGIGSYPARPRDAFIWRSTAPALVSVSEIGIALAHSAGVVGVWVMFAEDTTLRDSMTITVVNAGGSRAARR